MTDTADTPKAPTRAELLSEFVVEAVDHYQEPLAPSIVSLLTRLVKVVPASAFSACEPRNRILLLGEIEDESAESFLLDELWPFHYYTPISEILEIHLSSPGGYVDSGLTIISAIHDIRRQGRKVHIHVTGEACSMAFWILQAADHRSMEPYASLMLHEEQGTADGSTTSRLTDAQFSKMRERLLFEALSERTGRPLKFYQDKAAGKDWFIDAATALAEAFVDEVAVVPPLPLSPAPAARTASKPRAKKSIVKETVS